MNQAQTVTVDVSNISESVVTTIAEAEGTTPLELNPPLFEAVDPDALDQIFAPTLTDGRMQGQVTFSYLGYQVTVSGDGHVSVKERDA